MESAASDTPVSAKASGAGSKAQQVETKAAEAGRAEPVISSHSTSPAIAMPATPVAISSISKVASVRKSGGSDVAGTSSDSLWGSSNSGSGWNAYEKGKRAAGKHAVIMGSSPSNDAGCSSKAGRRARRNAKKAAADAKADVYAY